LSAFGLLSGLKRVVNMVRDSPGALATITAICNLGATLEVVEESLPCVSVLLPTQQIEVAGVLYSNCHEAAHWYAENAYCEITQSAKFSITEDSLDWPRVWVEPQFTLDCLRRKPKLPARDFRFIAWLQRAISIEKERAIAALLPDLQSAKPTWNKERRELFFGETLCKKFRTQRGNQEIILESFEESGWPPRMDDPLPGGLDVDRRKRLSDAVRALNQQQEHLIFFEMDGSGEGVLWKPHPAPPSVVPR